MMGMEPFHFFQEDATATATATVGAGALDDLLSWDFFHPRGFSDLLQTPAVFDSSPLLPREDVLSWGVPLAEEPVTPLGPPPPTPGGELLDWDALTLAQSTAPVTPLLNQPRQSPAAAAPRSSFVRYERSCYYGERPVSRAGGGEGRNVHRRVIEFLTRIPAEKAEKKAAEGSRCFRHMMRERQRRERLSQSYADLHSMIVPRPKPCKNSIVLAAVAYVRELKGTRESLQRRHQELRAALGEGGAAKPEGATVKLRVGNPTSPLDSMIAALRRLKGMDVTARCIRSSAGDRELSAVIDVQTKLAVACGADEVQKAAKHVERAVQGALVEVEWKLRGGSGPAHGDPMAAAAPIAMWAPAVSRSSF